MTIDVVFKLLLLQIITDQSAEWTHFVGLLVLGKFILADPRKAFLAMLALHLQIKKTPFNHFAARILIVDFILHSLPCSPVLIDLL